MTENKLLFQDNAITQAKYELTATQKNILYMVMAQLKSNDPADQYYYISVKDLELKTGIKMKYAQVRDSIDAFMSRIIEVRKPNKNILRSTFFSSSEYINGKGIIEIGLDPKIRPYFFDLKKHFTTFQLDMALSVKSKFSKRLYEMLSQHKDLDKWTVEITLLKEMLSIINPKTGKDTYAKWSLFEQRVLKVAQNELKENTNISFKYKAEKTGRKFTHITFYIHYKEFQTSMDFSDSEAMLFERLVNKCKLRKDQVVKVMESHSVEEINKILYQVSLTKPKNIGAYCAKIFKV